MRLRIFVEPQQGATYEDLLRVAQTTEELGFDGFFRSDHYVSFGGDGLPGPTDAWVTLAGIARETSTVRIGTLVSSATFRLPGPLAISVAQVDEMSGGRVELGLGAGWHEEEHRAYGIPFPPTAERFDRLEEQLEIVTGLWGTPPGQTYSFGGRHYVLADSPALPKPRQSPPPVIVGGAGPTRTPRLAARFASEFNAPFLSAEEAAAQYGRVRDACADAGRDPAGMRLSAAVRVCCGSTEQELARRAAAIGQEVRELRDHAVAGLPAEVVDRCRAYGEAGAATLYLQVLDLSDMDHLRLLADEVLPALR